MEYKETRFASCTKMNAGLRIKCTQKLLFKAQIKFNKNLELSFIQYMKFGAFK